MTRERRLLALLISSVVLLACESAAPTLTADPKTTGAAGTEARATESQTKTSDELEAIRKTAKAAAPDLGGVDAGQKSGVNR